ncbi:MAG: helix-turn-helix domain-containing protein [Armatimonadota bacterium]|jgi:hypothetical protein
MTGDQTASLFSGREESAELDFKESFDPGETGDWCELIKDIVAMANSGGGTIVVGVCDDGTPSQADVTPLLTVDPAQVTDKLSKYTSTQVIQCGIRPDTMGGFDLAVLRVAEVHVPVPFTSPGEYPSSNPKKPKRAFAEGTVYFRHGAKSEPALPEDLRSFAERILKQQRHEILQNLQTIVHAPAGAKLQLAGPDDEADISARVLDEDEVPTGANIIARVNKLDDFPFTFRDVEGLTGIKSNPLTAVMRELGVYDDEDLSQAVDYRSSTLWKYSQKCVDLINAEKDGLDLSELYHKHIRPKVDSCDRPKEAAD